MSRRYFIQGAVGIMLSIVASSCLEKPETNVSPERIYTSYSLTYDEENDETYARALFSADTRVGWRQELSGSAKVECNEVEMRFNEDVDEYLIIFDGFETPGEFKYVDASGSSYLNTTELDLIGYPSGLDSINIMEDFVLEWVGDNLEEGEIVSLSFEEESLGVIAIFESSEIGANSVIVPRDEMVKLGLGIVTMRLAWQKFVETDQDPGVGGEILSVTILQPMDLVVY